MTRTRKKSTAWGGPGYPRNPMYSLHFGPEAFGPPPPQHKTRRPPRRRPWPPGCIIVVDTREQDPYRYPGRDVVGTLETGDYSVKGMEHLVTVERKTFSDAWSSIGSGCGPDFEERRDRFHREWQRLEAMQYPAVVLECDFADLRAGNERSQVHPSVVIGTYISWSVRYRVPVWLAGNRENGRGTTARILCRFYELNNEKPD